MEKQRIYGGRIRAKSKAEIIRFYKRQNQFSIDNITQEKNSRFANASVYKVWLKKRWLKCLKDYEKKR